MRSYTQNINTLTAFHIKKMCIAFTVSWLIVQGFGQERSPGRQNSTHMLVSWSLDLIADSGAKVEYCFFNYHHRK